ncbi:hypothetical protein C8R47DRAFT_701306, partial [Mycena vitilis]
VGPVHTPRLQSSPCLTRTRVQACLLPSRTQNDRPNLLSRPNAPPQFRPATPRVSPLAGVALGRRSPCPGGCPVVARLGGWYACVAPSLLATTMALLAPVSWDNVHFVRNAIKFCQPAFARRQAAWLFPDGNLIGRRLWVRVPVTRGLRRAYRIEQLEFDMWLNCGRSGAVPTTDGEHNTLLVERFPFDEPVDLEFAYWIVVTDQRTWGPNVHPVNALINGLVPGLALPWRGNVLVFKRGKGKGHPVINISDNETTFVEAIIKRVIRDGLIGSARSQV